MSLRAHLLHYGAGVHSLQGEKSRNFFKHVADMVKSSFKIDHFGTEAGFYEASLETINSGRKWLKEEVEVRDAERLG